MSDLRIQRKQIYILCTTCRRTERTPGKRHAECSPIKYAAAEHGAKHAAA